MTRPAHLAAAAVALYCAGIAYLQGHASAGLLAGTGASPSQALPVRLELPVGAPQALPASIDRPRAAVVERWIIRRASGGWTVDRVAAPSGDPARIRPDTES